MLVRFEVTVLSRIYFVSVREILEYMFVISKEANMEVGVTGLFQFSV